MLRFGNRRAPPPRPLFSSQGRGVWMLLLMLGAVIVLMRQLEQPATVEYLGRIFGASPAAEDSDQTSRRQDESIGGSSARTTTEGRKPASGGPWAAVRDNALFLPAEQEAWFLLWDEVQRTEPAELDRRAAGQATYAQLVNQPDVYRGRAVRVRGRVLRESVKPAPENSLGIADYHQLVLAPVGGGDWPVMIYCLELPPDFPRGDGLKEDLTVVGLFFKNWSYPYDGGMGLAPVLVTKTIDWQPARARTTTHQPQSNQKGLWIGAAAAMITALGFIAWVLQQTRRPSAAEEPLPDFERLETGP